MASELTHKQAKRKAYMVPGLCCFICTKPIKDLHTDVATTICTDPLTARHNSCAPGTAKWMQSPYGQQSEIAQYYISNGEESLIVGSIPNKTKKAFPKKDVELTSEQRQLVGRIKYMAYMDTQLKDGAAINWTLEGVGGSGITVINDKGAVTIIDRNKTVLSGIPHHNAAEELRSYFLGRHDDKARAAHKEMKVEGTVTGRVSSTKPNAVEISKPLPVIRPRVYAEASVEDGKEESMAGKKATEKKPVAKDKKPKKEKKPQRTLADLEKECNYQPTDEGEE